MGSLRLQHTVGKRQQASWAAPQSSATESFSVLTPHKHSFSPNCMHHQSSPVQSSPAPYHHKHPFSTSGHATVDPCEPSPKTSLILMWPMSKPVTYIQPSQHLSESADSSTYPYYSTPLISREFGRSFDPRKLAIMEASTCAELNAANHRQRPSPSSHKDTRPKVCSHRHPDPAIP